MPEDRDASCSSESPETELERLREAARVQRRPLAKPLANFVRRYPDRRRAMAWAFQARV